jgi:hypothetical protein
MPCIIHWSVRIRPLEKHLVMLVTALDTNDQLVPHALLLWDHTKIVGVQRETYMLTQGRCWEQFEKWMDK